MKIHKSKAIPHFFDNNSNQADKGKSSDSVFKSEFPLVSGWALKSRQKLGKRGSGKRMSEKVKNYLKAFFTAGDADKTKRMSAEAMVKELNELAKEGELETDEIPKVKTVDSWITRYSCTVRTLAAEERHKAMFKASETNQTAGAEGSQGQRNTIEQDLEVSGTSRGTVVCRNMDEQEATDNASSRQSKRRKKPQDSRK